MSIKPFEKKVWLSSPTMHGEEQEFVKEAFDTNWVSTVGKNINELERSVGELLSGQHAVALASGTSALHLALRCAVCDIFDKDESVKKTASSKGSALCGMKVLCTDMTFDATVNPVSYECGEQVFVDSEYDTWNMDPAALKRAFEKHPDARIVLVANLYGTPAKLDEIRNVCDEHDAILIEDAAESLGATYKGVQTGTFGHYNAISFNGNKIITTSGGGMFLSSDKESADKVRKWSTQARDNAPWYQHSELGYNYRLSNILAGIGRGQMLHLDEHIAQKKAIYERYKEGFKDLPVQMNPFDKEIMEPNYWLSCLLIDADAMCKQHRTDFEATYVAETGKSCPTQILEELNAINAEGRPIWKPMHMQPIFAGNDFVSAKDGDDVGADIFERGLCLPSDNKMTPEQQDVIIEVIKRCFD